MCVYVCVGACEYADGVGSGSKRALRDPSTDCQEQLSIENNGESADGRKGISSIERLLLL